MKKLLISSLSLVAILSLAGCSTDDEEVTDDNTTTSIETSDSLINTTTEETTENTETTEISGRVADGYLVGAKVCLDKNQNMICEDNEANTTTDDTGSYTLKIDVNDKDKYPILVEVSEDVVDLDTNKEVNKSYKLMSMKPDFISPLTTLSYVASMVDTDTDEAIQNNINELFYDYNIDNNISLYENYIETNNTSLHNVAKEIANIFMKNLEVVNVSMEDKEESDRVLTAYLPVYFAIVGVDDYYNLTNALSLNRYTQIQLFKSAQEINTTDMTLYGIVYDEDWWIKPFWLDSIQITDDYIVDKYTTNIGIYDVINITNIDDYINNNIEEEWREKIVEENNQKFSIETYREENWCDYYKKTIELKEADLSNITYKPSYLNKDISFKDGAKIYFSITKTVTPTYEELAQFLDENSSSCIVAEVEEENLTDFIENNSTYSNEDYKIVDNKYLIIGNKFYQLKDNKLYRVDVGNYEDIDELLNKEAILDIISQYKTEEKPGDELVGKTLYNYGNKYIFNEENISIYNNTYGAKVEEGNYTFEINDTNCAYKNKFILDKFMIGENEYYEDWNNHIIDKFNEEDEKYYIHEIIASQNVEDVVNSLDDSCVYKEDIEEDTLKDMIDNNVTFKFSYEDDWKKGIVKISDWQTKDYEVVTIDDEDYLLIKNFNYEEYEFSDNLDRLFYLKDGNLTYIDFNSKEQNVTMELYNQSAYDKIK